MNVICLTTPESLSPIELKDTALSGPDRTVLALGDIFFNRPTKTLYLEQCNNVTFQMTHIGIVIETILKYFSFQINISAK